MNEVMFGDNAQQMKAIANGPNARFVVCMVWQSSESRA